MKVALVVPDLAGAGAQRVMLELAAGLAEAGVQVDVVAAKAKGPLAEAIPAGVNLVDLGASRGVAAFLPLRGYFAATHPDAAVACLHLNLVAIAAARIADRRIRVIATQHNHLSTTRRQQTSWRDRAIPALLARALRKAHGVVAVSQGVADDLERALQLPVGSVAVIYNPIDLDRLRRDAQAEPTLSWPGGSGPRLLAVGRLTAQKDFPTLLRAVSMLDDARLLILGEGEDHDALQAMVEDLSLGDRVRLAGFVDNPLPYFRACSAFVLSSLWEGLPTVLIEALALAPRIVSTDCPAGPKEILEAGRHGVLVPPGDAAALASGIRQVLAEPPRQSDRALERFNRSAMTEQYLAILESAQ